MPKDTRLNFRIESDLVEVAKKEALAQGITLSQLVRNYFRSLKPLQQEDNHEQRQHPRITEV